MSGQTLSVLSGCGLRGRLWGGGKAYRVNGSPFYFLGFDFGYVFSRSGNSASLMDSPVSGGSTPRPLGLTVIRGLVPPRTSVLAYTKAVSFRFHVIYNG